MLGHSAIRERTAAFRQLATMLASGMSVSQALAVLGERVADVRLRAFFKQAAEETGKGRRLSELMRQRPDLFSPLALAMVEAAEQSGRLDEILRRLADYYEHEYQIRLMLSRETFYPKILVLAILFIPLGGQVIAAWILRGSGSAVVVLLKALAIYAVVFGVPAAALWMAYKALASSEQGRASIDRLKLALPLLGKVVRQSALARFSRALAALYGAGVSVPKALELAGNATANAALREVAHRAAQRAAEGEGLTDALAASGLADGLVLSMLRTGEQTGNLEETMDHVAAYYEDETRTAIKQMAVAIVPVAVIMAAIVVGIMVIGFYTRLYAGLTAGP